MPYLTDDDETPHRSIPVWDLQGTHSDAPEKEEMIFLRYLNPGNKSEIVLGEENRRSVRKEDILRGGKYRAIVKLFLHFENSSEDSWAVGTGWLAEDDVVVTAGHCAFDWSYNLGRLNKVKVYAGYSGKHRIGNPEVEFRAGKRVATTPEWVENPRRQADIAFIKLDRAFDGITPIKYKDTPEEGDGEIGVVGYPGDLQQHDEPGAIMYEHFEKTKWNLVDSRWKMLEYSIDTNGGNSGSPVFDKEDMASIGVHTYGGGTKNSATVIGEFGNPFDIYFDALNKGASKPMPTLPRECLVSNLGGSRRTKLLGRSCRDSGTEFLDVLGNILKSIKKFPSPIPRNILLTNSSLTLGPLGIPAGAVASITLGTAASTAGGEITTAESGFKNNLIFNRLTERAILEEAALAAIQKISPELREEENIFTDINNTIKKLLSVVKKINLVVIKKTLKPLLHLILDELRKTATGSIKDNIKDNAKDFPSLKTTYRPSSTKKTSFISTISDVNDKKIQKFVKHIITEGVSENTKFK